MINVKQAKKFCKEDISKIKNYDKAIADKTQTWHCHHMTETWWNCSAKDLIENECYYNRKACELIFLTPAEHRRLHMHKISDETRKKMSEARKGRTSPRKGVTLSDETRRKMSESQKGHTVNEDTRKKMSEAHKGHTVNEETRKKMSESRKGENHPMYGKKHSEETRKKMSEAAKRRHAAQS